MPIIIIITIQGAFIQWLLPTQSILLFCLKVLLIAITYFGISWFVVFNVFEKEIFYVVFQKVFKGK